MIKVVVKRKKIIYRGELKQQIQELENLDIVSMVRECGMTPEQLSALLEKLQLPAAGKKEVLSVEL